MSRVEGSIQDVGVYRIFPTKMTLDLHKISTRLCGTCDGVCHFSLDIFHHVPHNHPHESTKDHEAEDRE